MPFRRIRPRFAHFALALLAACSTVGGLSCSASPAEPDAAVAAALVDEDGAGGEGAGDSTLAELCSTPTLACATNKWVGAAVNAQALADVPMYAEVLAREFDYITPENVMKWGPLQPTPGEWDFGAADALLARAAANQQSVKGHALVWHLQMPVWAEDLPRAALLDAVQAHVRTTVRHFRGRVRAWDVVNEAIADGGAHPVRGGVHSRLGISGMADAFKWARAEDPEAKLFYNDYGIEGLSSKSDAVYRLLQELIAAGAPIDGVGFQSHLSTKSYPSLPALRANIRRFAALGLSVNVSELDVRTMEVPGTRAQRRAAQAIVYQEVASACATTAACEALTLWGFTDAYSWVDEYFEPDDDPLPFDEQYAKKPAYAALRAGLSGTRLQTTSNLMPEGSCESLAGWSAFAGGSLALVPSGRHGAACRVGARTQAYHGPSLSLKGRVQHGDTLRVTAYARLNQAGSVRMTLKKTELGEDEYLSLASGAADSSGWTLLSANVTMGWQSAPSELVLYFESPAVESGAYASLFVDDVSVQVLSRPSSP